MNELKCITLKDFLQKFEKKEAKNQKIQEVSRIC